MELLHCSWLPFWGKTEILPGHWSSPVPLGIARGLVLPTEPEQVCGSTHFWLQLGPEAAKLFCSLFLLPGECQAADGTIYRNSSEPASACLYIWNNVDASLYLSQGLWLDIRKIPKAAVAPAAGCILWIKPFPVHKSLNYTALAWLWGALPGEAAGHGLSTTYQMICEG